MNTASGLIGIFFAAVACLAPIADQSAPPSQPMTVVWQKEIALEGVRHVSVGERAVIVTGSESGVSAHAPDDGRLLWHGAASTSTRPATIGRLVVIAVQGGLQALDQETGQQVWRTQSGSADGPTPLSLSSTAALVFAIQGTAVTALRPDGSVAWQRALPSAAVTQLVGSGDLLLAGLQQSEIAALDPGTGATRWTVRLPAAPTALTTAANQLFVPTAKGELFAYRVSPAGLKRMWRHRDRAVPAIGAAAVSERRVFYALIDNTLKAFDRNGGTKVWTTPLSSRALSGPMLLGDYVIVPLVNVELAQVAAADGKMLPRPTPSGAATGRVGPNAMANGSLYGVITAGDGSTTLVAWRAGK